MNVDPELRKRVERIKSSPVQLYREAGDYSNRELVEGIVVSPDDIAAIEAVARADATAAHSCVGPDDEALDEAYRKGLRDALIEAANHRMVQPDHYQRWER